MNSLTKNSFISLSVILGSLCVILIFLLCKKLSTDNKTPLYDQPRVIKMVFSKKDSSIYFSYLCKDSSGREFVIKTKAFQ